jgi:prepilin-type N-terminal cleavage/methylation domain-containing protein/prepilin-type processing-associated H-X9-DG protein
MRYPGTATDDKFRRCRGRALVRFDVCPGFTLIELLVVVAIIAVLAGLLLPGLSKAKSSAHNAVCRGNLRQIMLGAQLYTQDFGNYPPHYSLAQQVWFDTLKPYVNAEWPEKNLDPAGRLAMRSGIYVCPAYDRFPALYVGSQGIQAYLLPYGSYGYNANGTSRSIMGEVLGGLGGQIDVTRTQMRFTKESDVLKPTEMIAFGDSSLAPKGEGGFDIMHGYINLAASLGDLALRIPKAVESSDVAQRRMAYAMRHSGRVTLTYCDGHVDIRRPLEIADIKSKEVLSKWNPDNQAHADLLPTNYGF